MFIPRKTKKIQNLQKYQDNIFSGVSTPHNLHGSHTHKGQAYDLELSSHPFTQYFVGLLLIGFSIYLFYSASGGINSISGFNQNKWWQYLIASIPLLCAILVMIVCESQLVFIKKNHNQFIYEKKRLFCSTTHELRRELNDINGMTLSKKDGNSMYCISISFRTCETLQILSCVYESSAREYFEQLTHSFTEQEISEQMIVIRNLQVERQ